MIYRIAMLSQDLTAPKREFRILPPGVFRARDGRPAGLPGWKMDADIAHQIAADLAARDDLVIDYEHQTLRTKENGQPAPAAGWFSQVIWREGQGLFALDVKWTDKAKAMLASGEYRFISPVFTYSAVTGQVERLLSLGLTNNPALTGLTDMAQASLAAASPEQLAALTRNASAPTSKLPATMSARDKAVMHQCFPGVWAHDQ